MHAHDFRDAAEFKGRRLLLVGSSYSAEDIAMQTLKYGAAHVTITYRNEPMGFKWPKGIEERPLVQRFDATSAYFKDGTKCEVGRETQIRSSLEIWTLSPLDPGRLCHPVHRISPPLPAPG